MISIVVPLYNYRNFIEDNIKSILCQTHTDWELIIVNDASTDDPFPIIEKYLSDKIKYVLMEENKGYSAAKNVGIRNSTGDLIVVLDADDMLTPKSLAIRVKYLEEHPKVQWVHGRAYEFSGSVPPYEFKIKERKAYKRLMKMLKTKNYKDMWKSIHAQTIMVRRSVYEKVGLYEESLRSSADKEMWARIINHIDIPFYINKFLCYYRSHKGQMHRSKTKLKNIEKLENRRNKLIKRRKRSLDGVIRF